MGRFVAALACGSTVRWYVSAMSANGIEWGSPANAPTDAFVSYVADATTPVFSDDMETPQGWTVGIGSDTATSVTPSRASAGSRSTARSQARTASPARRSHAVAAASACG